MSTGPVRSTTALDDHRIVTAGLLLDDTPRSTMHLDRCSRGSGGTIATIGAFCGVL